MVTLLFFHLIEVWSDEVFLTNHVNPLSVFILFTTYPNAAFWSHFSAMRGRVYLPQDELTQFGLCDEDILRMRVSDEWREFMKEQIKRARFYFKLAEEGASQLDKASRWPVWSSLMLYREILEAIEENDYNNFTKRAYVGRSKKFLALPLAYTKSISPPTLVFNWRWWNERQIQRYCETHLQMVCYEEIYC